MSRVRGSFIRQQDILLDVPDVPPGEVRDLRP